jgi:hypothetical protein
MSGSARASWPSTAVMPRRCLRRRRTVSTCDGCRHQSVRERADAHRAGAPARARCTGALPLELPASRSSRPRAARWSTSSRTTCCPRLCRSTRRCSPSSAARPAPASRRW